MLKLFRFFPFHKRDPYQGEELIKDRIHRLFQVPSTQKRVNSTISNRFIWEHIHQVTSDVPKR